MKFRTLFITLFLLLSILNSTAQPFNIYFHNKTLRLDYQFAGNAENQYVFLDQLSTLPSWAGRRDNLSELPLEGNGQIIVRDNDSKQIIYKTSFSSLFQEWLTIDESKILNKSFENTFLVPYPKDNIEIEVLLFNQRKDTVARMNHVVNPTDILISQKGTKDITPHQYIMKNGDSSELIDIAILAEGYTAEESEAFYEDAKKAMESIFFYEPFAGTKHKFNVVAVMPASKDKGISVPRNNEWKDTAVKSHFDTFYSDRYLTTSNVKAIHDALAGIPYEHIVILANTDVYGGGGIYNSYTLTTTHHALFKPVIAHEFGHSFGGLGDEYFYENDAFESMYPLDIEPWEQNITTMIYPEKKWFDMFSPTIPIPTPVEEAHLYPVGVYEGAGYLSKGIYRPANDCRMRTNQADVFCPVCQRALLRLIEFYTTND